MSEWQPIETAPKDGRQMLISNGVDIIITCWNEMDRYTQNKDIMDMQPTHWMPLPSPPEQKPC